MNRPRPSVLFGFVIASFLLRLMPWAMREFGLMSIDPETTVYPWNFSPFFSVCLFGAAFMPQNRQLFGLMLGSWLLGDIAIGAVYGKIGYAFYPGQFFTYLGYATLISIGFVLRKHRSWPAIAGTGLVGAVAFFIISNFGTWAMGNGLFYPLTADGLMTCYAAGIPFFRYSLISMAIFLPVLFSGYAVVKTEAPEPVAELAVQTG